MKLPTNHRDWTKLKTTIGIILIMIVPVILGVRFINHRIYVRKNFVQSNTPTIFVHGWSGTLNSEKFMVASAQASGVAKQKMIITVSPKGKIKVRGNLNHRVKNPMIMLKFRNNRAGEVKYAEWLTKVCHLLKQKYHVNQLNFVGHSMGAYATIYYNLLNGNRDDLPRTNKVLVIAGPYNGIINNQKSNQPLIGPLAGLWNDWPNKNRLLKSGKPKIIHPEYKLLLDKKQNFPKQARVLNLYGNLGDGSNSDGVVTIASALSLGYILKNHVSFYQTYEAYGRSAQHSELHNQNVTVDNILISFLWAKNYQVTNPTQLDTKMK